MQEMQAPDGSTMREVFAGYATKGHQQRVMDARRSELESQGYQFVKREKVGRNDSCPCGSGAKFKRCCIEKFERGTGGTYVKVMP